MSKEYDFIDESCIDEYEEVEQVAPKPKQKRQFKESGIVNVKANLAKGRAKRLEMIKQRKEQEIKQKEEDDKYNNFYVNEGGLSTTPQDENDDYEYDYQDEPDYEYQQPIKVLPTTKRTPKAKAVVNRKLTVDDRLDKTEQLLLKLIASQQPVKRRKAPARKAPVRNQTVIKIPKAQPPQIQQPVQDHGLNSLMKMFN